MAQNVVDFSDNPTGAELMDDYLDPLEENFLTSHSGVTRPSYAKAGTLWVDMSATPWLIKLYTGTNDITIGKLDTTNNNFIASNPLTNTGDLLARGSSGDPTRIAAGTAGAVLTSNGPDALPSYQSGTYANGDLSNLTSTGQALFTAKQDVANLVQNLTSPSATTYLSTEGVKNESDRIISIMNTILPTRIGFPDYTQGSGRGAGTFTAEQPLFLYLNKPQAGNNSGYIYVNNALVAALEGSSQGYNRTAAYAFAYTGDSVMIQLNNASCTQYPLR